MFGAFTVTSVVENFYGYNAIVTTFCGALTGTLTSPTLTNPDKACMDLVYHYAFNPPSAHSAHHNESN